MEISTTTTFDKLFKALPESVQKKARRQTFSKTTLFIHPCDSRNSIPKVTRSGAFGWISLTGSYSSLLIPVMLSSVLLAIIIRYMIMIFSNSELPPAPSLLRKLIRQAGMMVDEFIAL